MEAAKTTIRSKSFSELEKEALKRCIQRYANIIENKKTDGTTNKKKQEAWDSVCLEYNALPQVSERSEKQLKRAWEALKASFKKNAADVARHRLGTGGGPPIPDPPPDPLMEEIAPHLIHTIKNQMDCDATPLGNEASGSAAVDFADDFLEIDIDPEVVLNIEPPGGICQTPGRQQSTTPSTGVRSSRSRSRLSVISEEHQERMVQLVEDAKRAETLHELHVRESTAALAAAEFKAKREEIMLEEAKMRKECLFEDLKRKSAEEKRQADFLFEELKRKTTEEATFQRERHRLELDQMRDLHELHKKRLEQ